MQPRQLEPVATNMLGSNVCIKTLRIVPSRPYAFCGALWPGLAAPSRTHLEWRARMACANLMFEGHLTIDMRVEDSRWSRRAAPNVSLMGHANLMMEGHCHIHDHYATPRGLQNNNKRYCSSCPSASALLFLFLFLVLLPSSTIFQAWATIQGLSQHG